MQLQLMNRKFLSSAFLLSLTYKVYALRPNWYPFYNKNNVADTPYGTSDFNAVDLVMNDDDSSSSISDGYNAVNLYYWPNFHCGQAKYARESVESTVPNAYPNSYPRYLVKDKFEQACTAIRAFHANGNKKSRKHMSCEPNLPDYYQNYPQLYKGPRIFFDTELPLYVCPVGTEKPSWLRKVIGAKTRDLVVISLGKTCRFKGLVRKRLWGNYWTKCITEWPSESGNLSPNIS
ncbi:hypothetical protein OnM2_062057 [Erysiphe neolycopersici]|uniref:Secreted effector protein n=1 Tax=Erysiphe neolycopersici TaxID=212602 RepID=A0A420HNX2_9PEZI|nr:hypothetical protein OnM2_062057 [Erysiphe neolycopersici]